MGDPTLVVIDGHSLLFRAYYALPPFSDSLGRPTNGVFGYASMVLKVLADLSPTHACAAFDPHAPTFRHELSADYKATRKSAPEDFGPQVDLAREVTQALGLPILEKIGFEADDVLGTIAKTASAQGFLVTLVTGDMDSLQLVTDRVTVMLNRRGVSDTVIFTPKKVEEKYGFTPERVPDYKALRGDSSDNILGVPGIGDKTATALITEYGGIEEIRAAIPDMPDGRAKRALMEHGDRLAPNLRLATIVTDVPVNWSESDSRWRDHIAPAVRDLFVSLDFRSLLPRLPTQGAAVPTPVVQARAERTPATSEEVAALVAKATSDHALCLRTVIHGHARTGTLVGVAAGTRDGALTAFIPAESPDLSQLHCVLEDENTILIGYEVKRDLLHWHARGVSVRAQLWDAQLAAYLVTTHGKVGRLDELAGVRVSRAMESEELFDGRPAPRGATEHTVDERAAYWCDWMECLAALSEELRGALETMGAKDLLESLEMPLVRILAHMEEEGIAVDRAVLDEVHDTLAHEILRVEESARGAGAEGVNLGSPKQLQVLLYDTLHLEAGRKIKTGRSTDSDTLEQLREAHPIVPLIMEWRTLTKLQSTYLEALPPLIEEDGRIHTSYNQAVAATGRLSSTDPNLQNIPIRGVWGQPIRRAFVARPNFALVSVDYSQIELRVLAHMSRDPALIEAFLAGHDIHAATAALVYGVETNQVTPAMRRHAKAVNFGIIYGLSDFGLSRDTGMDRSQAKRFIEDYFSLFSTLSAHMTSVRVNAKEVGYASTLAGRRRHLPDLNSSNFHLRGAAERMAINMPIQGTAADIMKSAMIALDAATHDDPAVHVLLQVHDELVVETPKDNIVPVASLMRTTMQSAYDLAVPLVVDVRSGPNWGELAPLSLAD